MRNTIQLIIIIIMSIMTTACGPKINSIPPTIEIIKEPKEESISIAELGDTVVKKYIAYTYDGIILFNDINGGGNNPLSIQVNIPKGELTLDYESKNWLYFTAKNVTYIEPLIGPLPTIGGIKIKKIDYSIQSEKQSPSSFKIWGKYHINTFDCNIEPQYRYKKVEKLDETLFKQELIYNGRVNNNPRFIYRELSENRLRDSFTQEIQYDISKDSTIGFKGLRLDIIEASNTSIKYKLIKNFPDTANTITQNSKNNTIDTTKEINIKSNKTKDAFTTYLKKQNNKAFFINPHDDSDYYYSWNYETLNKALENSPEWMLTYSINDKNTWTYQLERYKNTKIYKGIDAYTNKDYLLAYNTLKESQLTEKQNAYTWNRFGWSAYELANLSSTRNNERVKLIQESIKSFEKSIDSKGNKWDGNYQGLASAYLNIGNTEKAIDTLKSGYIKTKSENIKYELVSAFLKAGKKEEAIKELEKLSFLGIKFNTTKEGLEITTTPLHESPANEAGLLKGDIIISVSGKQMVDTEIDDATNFLRHLPYGTRATIQIKRNNQTITTTVYPFLE